MHPTIIAQSFQKASAKAVEILRNMSVPVDLNDRDTLLKSAHTSLNSKVWGSVAGRLVGREQGKSEHISC